MDLLELVTRENDTEQLNKIPPFILGGVSLKDHDEGHEVIISLVSSAFNHAAC